MPVKPTLYATATTLENARLAAVKFYCGSTVTLTPEGEGVHRIHTGRGPTPLVIREKKSRFRMESEH